MGVLLYNLTTKNCWRAGKKPVHSMLLLPAQMMIGNTNYFSSIANTNSIFPGIICNSHATSLCNEE